MDDETKVNKDDEATNIENETLNSRDETITARDEATNIENEVPIVREVAVETNLDETESHGLENLDFGLDNINIF